MADYEGRHRSGFFATADVMVAADRQATRWKDLLDRLAKD